MFTQNDEKFTVKGFWKLFQSEDQDEVHNSLILLLNHIRNVDYFDDFGKDSEAILPSIINQGFNDKRYIEDHTLHTIFDSTMKLIPQFIAKIPIDLITVVYHTIFDNLCRDDLRFFTVLGNVVEDTIAVGSCYERGRQQAIVNYMMNKLMTYVNNDNIKPEMKKLSQNLYALTAEVFPDCLKPKMISDLHGLIKKISSELCQEKNVESNEYLETCKLLARYSKVYSTLINDEQKYSFFDSIEMLQNKKLAVYILANIIESHPQYFALSDEKEDRYTFSHYMDLIFEQIENPQDVEDYNKNYATFTVQFLRSLSVLVDKFAKYMSVDQIDKCIYSDFDFLNLGIEESEEEDGDDSEDEQIFDDDEEMMHNDSDESWIIRCAAMKLAISLINEKPEAFYDTLFYISDDSYMPNYVTNLISDNDIGSKLETMRFLRIIIHRYKKDIESDVIEDFEKTLISQIKKGTKDQVLEPVIKTLTYMIHDIKKAPSLELSLKAIDKIAKVYRDNILDAILLFIVNILEYSSEVEIVRPIIQFVSNLLSKTKSHMIPTCLTVVSKIYHYYHRVCNKESSLKEDLDSLNENVITISENDGEVKSYAITTISVFVSCCPGLSTVQKSVDLIVNLLNDNSIAKASIGAIALISASESAQTLSKDIKSILEQLKEKIMLDPVITNRVLWTITILLNKNILGINDCQDIVPALFDIANSGEKNTRLLSLKILNRIYPNGCDSQKLCLLVQSITSSPLNEIITNEITKLVLVSAKSSLDNIKPFVDSLINKVKSNSLGKDESTSLSIISYLAVIIGVASLTNNEYGHSLISQLKSFVNDKGCVQIFALRCIGEIGSHFDLSTTDSDLVKSIFELMHNSDRNVFVSASESVGMMAVGSPDTILSQLMDAAKADNENNLTAFLFSIRSFVKKVNSIKSHIPKQAFDQIIKSVPVISDFLLSNAKDDFKETALTVSECLSGLVGISFDYSKKLIETATYITIRAIYIYMEEYSSYSYRNDRNLTEKEKEEIMSLVNQVYSKYDDEKPMLDYAIMLCVKFALTQKLCKELFEEGYVDNCLNGTNIQQSHNVIKTIGTEQNVINIGTELKSTSLTCIELFIKSDIADQLRYDDISEQILLSFSLETLYELRQKALDIISMIATSPIQEAQEYSIAELNGCTTTDFLKRFDKVITDSNPPNDVKVSFYTALISLLSIKTLPAEDERKLKGLLARHKNDPILINIEEINKFKRRGKSDSHYFTNNYTSLKLIEEFYPEAASIFNN